MREEHVPGGSLDLGPLTIEEYLALESGAAMRHEFVRGRIYGLAGTTLRHNTIVTNVLAHLRDAARARAAGCRAYVIDLKVRVGNDRVYYPDCVLVCAPHEPEAVVIDAPCIVVEVTSRSTRRVDRGEKLDAYLTISSLRGYVIIESDRRHVTLYARGNGDDPWRREEIVTTGAIRVPCVDSDLFLDDIYDHADPPLRLREDDGLEEEWLSAVDADEE